MSEFLRGDGVEKRVAREKSPLSRMINALPERQKNQKKTPEDPETTKAKEFSGAGG